MILIVVPSLLTVRLNGGPGKAAEADGSGFEGQVPAEAMHALGIRCAVRNTWQWPLEEVLAPLRLPTAPLLQHTACKLHGHVQRT